jgi:hypothetical protein
MCRNLSYSRGGGSNISSPSATVPPSIPADFCREVKSSLSSHSSVRVATSIHTVVDTPHICFGWIQCFPYWPAKGSRSSPIRVIGSCLKSAILRRPFALANDVAEQGKENSSGAENVKKGARKHTFF